MFESIGLRVFESIMLSKIFRTQKEEVIRRWRELHKEELGYLHYYYNNNIKDGEIGEALAICGRKKDMQSFGGET